MQCKYLKKLGLLIASIAGAAFMLSGCSDGKDGAPGKDGKDAAGTTSVASLTPDQWSSSDFAPKGEVLGVTINSPPVVKFKLTDGSGKALTGFSNYSSRAATATVASYPNVSFSLAKLVPGANGSPSKWVNYIVTTVPTKTAAATATRPSTDNTGTLKENSDGTYEYTFYRDITKIKDQVAAMTLTAPNSAADLGDLTYDKNLVHRLTIQVSGNARGTGTNTADGSNSGVTAAPMANPINIIYDFVPATGKVAPQRDITLISQCNECHTKLAFHGGGRVDTRYCVVCHNDQRKFGRTEATTTATGYSGSTYRMDNTAAGDFPKMVHQIHMGNKLGKTGYNYANVLYNEIGYPQDVTNCRKCHTNSTTAPQGDNWKNVPSRLACGACHDGIKWSDNSGSVKHTGGSAADDTQCALCHKAADIEGYHVTANTTPNNPSVPVGATNFTYDISSVTVNASNQPVVKFRIMAVTPPATTATPVVFNGTSSNPLTGFTGGPSFLVAYAQTQDGVTTPVDFNNLGRPAAQPQSVSIGSLLSTLGTPDSNGYYTATLTAAPFPAGAKLRNIALQGYFTQVSPAVARHTLSVVKAVSGEERRSVIDPAKCGSCHEWFEGHGGNRNIGKDTIGTNVCVVCHVPNLSSSGRGATAANVATYMSATDKAALTADGYNIADPTTFPEETNNFKDMIHGIHIGKDRTNPLKFVRDRSTAFVYLKADWAFPGIIKNCEACHKPGTYSTVPANVLATTDETKGADGKFTKTMPNVTDLVTTPFSAACVSCHDSSSAKAHIGLNGGQLRVQRGALNITGEACAACHGPGKDFDPVKVHK